MYESSNPAFCVIHGREPTIKIVRERAFSSQHGEIRTMRRVKLKCDECSGRMKKEIVAGSRESAVLKWNQFISEITNHMLVLPSL